MQRKLTLTVDEEVYRGLYETIGRGRISHFIQELVRPYVVHTDLEDAYRDMGADTGRELDALDWSEALVGDSVDAPR